MEALSKQTVEQYYNMTEEQRAFIVRVIETHPEWKKFDYMKALILFNKSLEIKCELSDDRLDEFVKFLDENNSQLNYWLKDYDREYRKSHGYKG